MVEVGLRAPTGAAAPTSFSLCLGRVAAVEAAMTDLLHFVALSLVACSGWRGAADRLRHGATPQAALELALQERAGGGPDAAAKLRSRAALVIHAARALPATAVPWSEAAYPAAL